MRLIDADKLVKAVDFYYGSPRTMVPIGHVKKLIDDQPTVVDVPDDCMERLKEFASQEAHVPAMYTEKERMADEMYKKLEERFSMTRSAT